MIKKEDVEKIAHLARLKLSEDEKILFTGQLKDIVGYIDLLGEAEAGESSPEAHILIDKLSFREDQPVESSLRDKILANAPDKEAASFRVKKVLQ